MKTLQYVWQQPHWPQLTCDAGVSINERQRKVINRLLESSPDAFEGGMNTRKYCSLTGASRATAFRELDALVELGMLRREGQGRSTRYTLG